MLNKTKFSNFVSKILILIFQYAKHSHASAVPSPPHLIHPVRTTWCPHAWIMDHSNGMDVYCLTSARWFVMLVQQWWWLCAYMLMLMLTVGKRQSVSSHIGVPVFHLTPMPLRIHFCKDYQVSDNIWRKTLSRQ